MINLKKNKKVIIASAVIILVVAASWYFFGRANDPFKGLSEDGKTQLAGNTHGSADLSKKETKDALRSMLDDDELSFIDYFLGAQQALELKDKDLVLKLTKKAEHSAPKDLAPEQKTAIIELNNKAKDLK